MSIGPDEIEAFLRTQDDFALELAVMALASDCGFEALHAGTYVDPITQKNRQFDVRAMCMHESRHVSLAIECKAVSSDHPLVVLRTPRLPVEGRMYVVTPLPESAVKLAGFPQVNVRQIPTQAYAVGRPVGRSLTQLKKEKGRLSGTDSDIHEKWAQALASAFDLINASYALARKRPSLTYSTVLPVLVVPDNALWVADYDADGRPVLSRTEGGEERLVRTVDETTFYVGRRYEVGNSNPHFYATHLHILTVSGLTALLRSMSNNGRHWTTTFPPILGSGAG